MKWRSRSNTLGGNAPRIRFFPRKTDETTHPPITDACRMRGNGRLRTDRLLQAGLLLQDRLPVPDCDRGPREPERTRIEWGCERGKLGGDRSDRYQYRYRNAGQPVANRERLSRNDRDL